MTGTHRLGTVASLDDLRGPDGRFLAGDVDVVGDVILSRLDLERLPVRFGAVDGSFWCDGNRLVTLEGAPSTVGGNFWCAGNRLTSLEGAPSTVGGSLHCYRNRLTSLRGVHRILRKMGGWAAPLSQPSIHFGENPITSGGIGLILVEGLHGIWTPPHPAFGIIGEYLGQGRKGLLRCQEALHEAGHGEFARL